MSTVTMWQVITVLLVLKASAIGLVWFLTIGQELNDKRGNSEDD